MADDFEDHCWKDVVGEDLLEIYSAYRRDTTLGSRPALLAIDLYDLVFQGGPRPVREVAREFPSSCGIHAWNAMEPIRRLLAMARAWNIPVIYTTSETRTELHAGSVRATHRSMSNLSSGHYKIRSEFEPEGRDTIIYKQRASAFFGTPLVAHLVGNRVDTVIVCGETTSGCVRASVVDAYSFGFHTVVVEECCFDRSWLSHQINLFDMHHKYADVMHLDEVARHLERLKQAV
ncbi:MAG: isochorismatase family protein [Acidobacteria bacterium]|nr:isochorismatase family protein [Acidobacteriota bacterium]